MASPNEKIKGYFDRHIYSSWPNGPQPAVKRLNEELFLPRFKAPFSLKRSDSFFAIGSCFARAIEYALFNRGGTVFSLTDAFDRWKPRNEIKTIHTTNKYSPISILQDLNLAFDNEVPSRESSFYIETEEGLYLDPFSSHIFAPAPLDEVIERRKVTNEINRKLLNADVAVITWGLVEVWRDTLTGSYLNFFPGMLMQQYPGRFELEVMGFNKNMEVITEIYKLLTQKNQGIKIIMSVSPVPLIATFTGQDVVVANSYSKSCLRTVVGEFTAEHSDVFYFPSYEMVLNNKSPWQEDLRHIQEAFAHRIVEYLFAEVVKE
jgi:hypothetical protein